MASAQVAKANKSVQNSLHLSVNSENLKSTHSNYFHGISGIISKSVSPIFSLGLGIEYAHSPFHVDNDWNLYDLNFVPVFVSQKIRILQNENFTFYSAFREGLSFIHYQKEEFPQTDPGNIQDIHEKGFYGYAALGGSFRIYRKLALYTELGIKSYHISNYDLEVNPHGVNFMGGLSYRIR